MVWAGGWFDCCDSLPGQASKYNYYSIIYIIAMEMDVVN